jgi:hypothetical protein
MKNSAYPRKPARKPGRIRTLSLCQSKGCAKLGAGLAASAKHGTTAPNDCQEESNRSSAELINVNPSTIVKLREILVGAVGIEPSSPPQIRKLFIPRSNKNYKNDEAPK